MLGKLVTLAGLGMVMCSPACAVTPAAVPLPQVETRQDPAQKEMQERMASEGIEPMGGAPERFRSAIRRDVEKWKRVVRDAKITVQS